VKRFEKRPLEESFENPQEITSTSVLKHSRVQMALFGVLEIKCGVQSLKQ
jgi:hypothetical protein